MRKGHISPSSIGQPLLTVPEKAPDDAESETHMPVPSGSANAVIPSKKRRSKTDTLEGWIDVGLTEQRENEAKLAFFR